MPVVRRARTGRVAPAADPMAATTQTDAAGGPSGRPRPRSLAVLLVAAGSRPVLAGGAALSRHGLARRAGLAVLGLVADGPCAAVRPAPVLLVLAHRGLAGVVVTAGGHRVMRGLVHRRLVGEVCCRVLVLGIRPFPGVLVTVLAG